MEIKMKRLTATLSIIILVALLLLCTGCQGDSIEVIKAPDKCVFYIGESIDVTGGQIRVVLGGEEKIVDMTPDMLAYCVDEENLSDITFKGDKMTASGKKTVTLSYSGMYVRYYVYVGDDVDNYRAYCYSRLDELSKNELSKNELSDDASLTAIADAKMKISTLTTLDEIKTVFATAEGFVEEYYSIKVGEDARDTREEQIEKAISELDTSVFSMDQSEQLEASIKKLREDVALSETKDELDALFSEFEKEVEGMRTHKANEFISALEKRFADEYEAKKIYYTEEQYAELVRLFIDYESIIREKDSEDGMNATQTLLFDIKLPAMPDIVSTIYDDCDALAESGVVFTLHKGAIDDINRAIVDFVKRIDAVTVEDVNRDDRVDVRDVVFSDSYKALPSVLALDKFREGSVLESIDSLMDEYETLKKANEEAPKVISAITAIGKVNLGSEKNITAARKAFSEWSEKYSIDANNANIELITNYDALVSAEKTFDGMPARAKTDALSIRDWIDDIEDNGIIYSNGKKGIGDDLASAEEEYAEWIETYGAEFAAQHINTSTKDYIKKLADIRAKYDGLVAQAKAVLNKMAELYEYADGLELDDDNYEAMLEKIDEMKGKVKLAYTDFVANNKGYDDAVSAYEELDYQIDYKVYMANVRSCVNDLKAACNKYVSELKEDSDKDKIRMILTEGEIALGALTYDPDISRYKNIEKLDEKKDDYIDKMKSKYDALTTKRN